MRTLFTGATGVVGREAIPRLVTAGHEVTGVARSDEGRAWLEQTGATFTGLDLFDAGAVDRAMADQEVVIHFATSIPNTNAMRRRSSWDLNDRLRIEGTSNLVDAAIHHEVTRFIQESITFFYADGGDEWLDEDAPIDPWWEVLDSALVAEDHVRRFTDSGGAGVSLRLAALYGPGPASADHIARVAARKLPILGSGDNYLSHLHVEDAGSALAAAMTAPSGAYNVSEDDPVTLAEDIETLASVLGAKAPRRVPEWLARQTVGPALGALTTSQRVCNVRFKTATGWRPRYPSVIEGWNAVVARSGLADRDPMTSSDG